MIQNTKKSAAWCLFGAFYLQLFLPAVASAMEAPVQYRSYAAFALPGNKHFEMNTAVTSNAGRGKGNGWGMKYNTEPAVVTGNMLLSPEKQQIGGPSSPEASAFKSVGSDNLVNLSTGDFSYSIPLLDVGGYPVNLFYNGGITMEQEASWTGLGWNINPGTVNRNMRGVPDDFNGTDMLTQRQNVKPNRTWGGELGADMEIFGLKKPDINMSLGFSYNNYLGPALELGSKVSLSLTIPQNVLGEKSAVSSLGFTAALGAKLSSRSGLTFTPSLNANAMLTGNHFGMGLGLSTDYNSRTGIKALNIHSEMSAYGDAQRYKDYNSSFSEGSYTPHLSASIANTSITFARPSYIPVLRMPMQNTNTTGQMEFGFGAWGVRGSLTANGYYSESIVPDEFKVMYKPLVGYLYAENGVKNPNAVMDFNRLADAEVTPNTPVISAPQYDYDIFSIQGEGTGGSIRAYRGDLGFMRDNVTTSKEKNISFGVDAAPPFHYGANVNIVSTPTRVGGWEDANNKLNQALVFRQAQPQSSFENVYFKNPGEGTVTNSELLNRIGGDNLVRFQLGGSKVIPTIEPQLEQFDKKTAAYKTTLPISNNLQSRDKRTQIITMLTAADATKVGLDASIKNYTGGFDANKNIIWTTINRVQDFRKPHHISEIDVLEQGGMRYVYGLPVYSVVQKDYTFTVKSTPANASDNLVGYSNTEPTTASEHMANKSKYDGYVQVQETPAYAASFLLTGLLSPDYVDRTGDGITEDDQGSAVKFNYTKSDMNHKWRTPRKNGTGATANFNAGIRSEQKDNKATISYGEREVWYLNSIESKSMIAIFKTDVRDDAKGVNSDLDGSINTAENANKKLTEIDLYTKAEIKAKGIANAKPVKSVIFTYDYALCKGTPDNANGGGKLTLRSIYFAYNGQNRASKEKYVFNYGNTDSKKDNPDYSYNASDRWGTYKPNLDSNGVANNPSSLFNIDYPYTLTDKSKDDIYAGAWSLKKILLPSGGQMEVQYEADDYGYVQNRRACNMVNLAGIGATSNFTAANNLYSNAIGALENNYLYIPIPQPLTGTTAAQQKQEIFSKYLDGINAVNGKKQLAIKLQVYMPKGLEPLTIYPEYDDYGVCPNNSSFMYVHMVPVDGTSPLVNSVLNFLTENIPGQAFPGYDVEVDGLQAFLDVAGAMLSNLKNGFKNVNQQMRDASKGRDVALNYSFIRLANPGKMKYGGGVRVKSVRVRDNWNKMTGQYSSVYGQDYDYTTTENINGVPATISSGVASYEPGIGSEENPFREILSFSNKLPLASAQYGAIEMPMLEGLYPAPSVVYSKVTVRSIHRKGTHGDSSLRSAIGKQVTEFYTAKDYPTYSAYTPMNSVEYNKNPFLTFFYKEVINRRTISQGFLVETNDMHGRMKSQTAYSESDEKTPLTATYHYYKNTGKNGLNDKVNFVYGSQQGAVSTGTMGVDAELMTDVREFSVKSNGYNGQGQVDIIYIPLPPPPAGAYVPIPTYFPLKAYTENIYRAVTCTKLINYHAIEDSVIVMDKGSVVSTKTIAYDAETGEPIVTQTANEFNDPIYNVSYPAYWAYSSTGLAYTNIGRSFTGANFDGGRISLTGTSESPSSVFESGDELYITSQSGNKGPACNDPVSSPVNKLWVFDRNKNSSPLTQNSKDLVFMDAAGNPYTMGNVNFRIIRSGKRNHIGLNVAAAVLMKNPIQSGVLTVNNTMNVVSATAIEYKEKWQTDADVFTRYTDNTSTCPVTPVVSCTGYVEKTINPYIKGLMGNFKPYRSYTYYGDRNETEPLITTAIRRNGFISGYNNFWNFDANGNLVPDYTNTKWVWNSQLTKVNAKGQELETVDPLQRYTAGQYGFLKNLPVAMTQNARYGESFAEGFEENTYAESINVNNSLNCDNNKYFSFSNCVNGTILNSDNLPFRAHSGKGVLSVGANSTGVQNLAIRNTVVDSFNLNAIPDYTPVLNTPGGNANLTVSAQPGTLVSNNTPQFSNFGMGVINSTLSNIPYNTQGTLNNFTSQYLQVTTPGVYNLTYGYYAWTDLPKLSGYNFSITVKSITTGAVIYSYQLGTNYAPCNSGWPDCVSAGQTLSICLPAGIYEMDVNYGIIERNIYSQNCVTGSCGAGVNCSASISGGFTTYKNLSTTNCSLVRPIAGSDSMSNPGFAVVPGKHMQFSAWVHEDCSTVPCAKSDFAMSNIEIWANGAVIPGSTIKRTGTIIDGWQKIEGDFTLPGGISSAEIHFINSNPGAAMYVDDIRLHPYNANMKSYVYDPRTLRLSAELDENNYASFYEYDEEGQLIRVKKETIQGIKTIQETRSAKQKLITDVQ